MLILGALLGELVSFSLTIPAIFVFVISIGIYFFKPGKWMAITVSFFSFLLLGAVCLQLERSSSNDPSTGVRTRIGVVQEVDKSDKVWKKHILQIESEKSGKTWRSIGQEVVLYSPQKLREGDVVLFRSELQKIQNQGNPGEFDSRSYWRSKNITFMGFMGGDDFTLLDYRAPFWLSQVFRNSRRYLSNIITESLPEKEASLANALLLGDKSKLSGETREAFGNAGAMHVLAISGLHVGIIMYLLFFVLKRLSRWITRNMAVIITLSFLWIFAGVTGWSPSVVRATLMFSLLLIGQQWARSGDPMNTLFFSAFVLLLINPLLLFDIGFQLSYGAMLGIFLFFDKITQVVKVRHWLLRKAWEGTALGISAQMFTIPIVLYHFHQFPNYFWLTNLGIMCLAGVILAFGLILFSLHFVPFLNVLIAVLLGWSLFALLKFVDWIDGLPFGVARGFELSPSEIILFVALMLSLLFFYNRKSVRYISLLLILLLVSNWQWHRYEASVNSEIVVFNSNSPVIACKYRGEIRAFYIGKRERANRLLSSYAKVMPGNLKVDSLEFGTISITAGDETIELIRSNNGVLIRRNNKTTFIRTRYRMPEGSYDRVLDMPYLQSRNGYYNLSHGALRSALN